MNGVPQPWSAYEWVIPPRRCFSGESQELNDNNVLLGVWKLLEYMTTEAKTAKTVYILRKHCLQTSAAEMPFR